ncbi:protein TonB [Rubricella aquisinus]|uniref:Protein TonB n=1 Tax=Rubricella aquisinus TaxID=2028108 RepID=A0A840WMJ2_9RHOB|nr:energy transducer TonB [Rubricella aquisinus]MBB5516298.1 protein TonB [Rubricella aquisinus]
MTRGFAIAVSAALAVHMGALAIWQAQSPAPGGVVGSVPGLAGADMAAMVEAWDRPPDTAEPIGPASAPEESIAPPAPEAEHAPDMVEATALAAASEVAEPVFIPPERLTQPEAITPGALALPRAPQERQLTRPRAEQSQRPLRQAPRATPARPAPRESFTRTTRSTKPAAAAPRRLAETTPPRPRPARLGSAAPAQAAARAQSASVSGGTGASTTGTAITAGAQETWVQSVRALIASHVRYPQRPRQLGITGRTIMDVQISRAGEVMAMRVATTSGNRRLDEAATAAVRRASPFPPPPEARVHRLTVPVRFEIE